MSSNDIERQKYLNANLRNYYNTNAPASVLPSTMYPNYPPPQQPLTFQTPRSYWFYICLILTFLGIAIALAAGILGIIFGTAGIVVSPSPPVTAQVTGGNLVPTSFTANSGTSTNTRPHAERFDAFIITGSLSALSPPVSNVTGIGTAIAIEQGGVEIYNGGIYARDRIVSDTGIGYPSDRRIKRNIISIKPQESLNTINKLTPVKFEYMKHWALHRDKNGTPMSNTPGITMENLGMKENYKKEGIQQRGFIAQDVKEILPNCVDTISRTLAPDENNPGVPRQLDDFHVMDMSAMIPDLVGSIQELNRIVQLLTEQNIELRAQLELIRKQQKL